MESILSATAPPLAALTVETDTSITVSITAAFVNAAAVFADVPFVTT